MADHKINLAILDDYHDQAPMHFASITPDVAVTSFKETLNPANPADFDELVVRLEPFTAISIMRERTPLPATLLARLPKLKLLMTTGNRNASIDLAACTAHGIQVVAVPKPTPPNVKHPAPDSTTTHTWTLILALARHVVRDHNLVIDGGWQGDTLATTVSGNTIGLCGLGRLGTAVGKIAVQAFGMRVICWSSSLTQAGADEKAQSVGLDAGEFEVVSKTQLFQDADVLSVHYVLSDRSRGMIGRSELGLMKSSSLLVNTSRGPLIHEEALLDVCERGSIRGVALDVFESEPLPKESPWRKETWGKNGRSDVLLSPHMGYGEAKSINSWYKDNAENLRNFIDGQPLKSRLN